MDQDIEASEYGSYIQHCSACGHNFCGTGAFQNRICACQPIKKHLCNTLTAAKEVIARKCQQRIENVTDEALANISDVIQVNVMVHCILHPGCTHFI